MNKNYTSPVIEVIKIAVQDVIMNSNELPEIDLHNMGTEEE